MDRETIHQAMNDKRLARQIRSDEPGSWTRLLEVALAQPEGWGGYDLVSLLSVAYDIGEQDGESERDMYGLACQLRELCQGNADSIRLSQVLALLDEFEELSRS